MYEIGELVLYGSTGVCRVSEIKKQGLPDSGEERRYYVLKPLYQSCVISVPVDSDKAFIRPIISRDEAERLINLIPGRKCEAYHSRAARDLTQHYDAMLKTHRCEDLIDLTMSIYAKKENMRRQKRRFGSVDERFLKQAEDLLFGELAAALEIPRNEVRGYITARVQDAEKAG